MKGVLVWVADENGDFVKNATVTIDDVPNVHIKTTDDSGQAYFEIGDIPQSHIWINHAGYQEYSQHLDLPPENIQVRVGIAQEPGRHDIILPPLELVHPLVERVHVEGLRFVTDSGIPWKMAFLDGFRDYERFLRGEDIRPLLEETVDLGGNGRRVFGMFDFGSPDEQRLYPREWGLTYYKNLAAFHELFAHYGLYTQWTVFADTQRACPGDAEQIKHWELVTSELRNIPNTLLEFCNELDAHQNRPDIKVAKPIGICSSAGSNGGGSDPPLPVWDYADLHPERPVELPKLLQSTTTLAFAINGTGPKFRGTQTATVASEPIGFADAPIPGKRVSDPGIAYLLGLGCQWGAGGTAHSDCGIQSVLLTDIQKKCVAEFIQGLTAE